MDKLPIKSEWWHYDFKGWEQYIFWMSRFEDRSIFHIEDSCWSERTVSAMLSFASDAAGIEETIPFGIDLCACPSVQPKSWWSTIPVWMK